MASAKVIVNLLDRSKESTRVGYHVSYNPAVDTPATIAVKANLVRAAIDTMTELNEKNTTYTLIANLGAGTLPASVWAQREHGLRVFYRDATTGRSYHMDVPGVDETDLRQDGTDVPIQTVGLLAFFAALELTMVSQDGNAIAVTGSRMYGKAN